MTNEFDEWNRDRLVHVAALRAAALALLEFSRADIVRVPLDDDRKLWVIAGPAEHLDIPPGLLEP